MNSSAIGHTRLRYDELPLSLRHEFPIDDIWDAKGVRFIGGGELRLVRVGHERAPNECVAIVTRGTLVVRFKVCDPRVGCLLYKICLRHLARVGNNADLLKQRVGETLGRSSCTSLAAQRVEEWRDALNDASDDLEDRRQLRRIRSTMEEVVEDGSYQLDDRGTRRLLQACNILRSLSVHNLRLGSLG
jgi:hypothetical protein